MAYTSNDKILASHYNGFVVDMNELYADTNSGGTTEATGGYGYGQSSISTVSVGTTITAAQWNALLGAMDDCSVHQGTAITCPPSVSAGDQITAFDSTAPNVPGFTTADIAADISSLRANRFNVDFSEGSVVTTATETYTPTWDTTLTQTITATFADWDEMRYFFNAGGKVRFSFSFTGTPSNTTENNWVAMASAVDVVSFDYTRAQSSGGVGTTGVGLYDLTSSDQQAYSYVPPGYSSEQYLIDARLNGAAGSANQIIFTLSFVTPSGGDTISLDLNSELALFENDVGAIQVTSPTMNAGTIST